MTLTFTNPAGVHPPAPSYSHVALVTGPGTRLVMSGQVGVTPEGTTPADAGAQIDQALANLLANLAAHDMRPHDIVKMTVFLTDAGLIGELRARRAALMQGAAPASTLLVVAALAAPQWVVEIECEAFRAG
ncbi:RidA family protein [Plastoroseomonas arctica]|uniref:RidA family protein n=1 Tax=Plastoroseomonas arctica TaxID=1509237 RepID=A0AAF1KQX2_9PROT|nr:RidA family protein [Plastoroseomonas arctica]MBR0653682.1 RidA family protein [Plastoroseomonas arctica]